MDERQQADPRLDAVEPDLLDEAALPVLGLSALTLGAVFAGGALGTLGRYLLEAFHPLSPGQFPWVTLLVNLSGSLAIALLLPLTAPRRHGPPVARSLLIVGFLG